MDEARLIKSAHEIKLLRIANEISAAAHLNVLKGVKHFKNESEIEATFLATSVAAQAKHQSYGVIAASGENASVLHYMANDQPLRGRQMVCLDAGAEWECYSSDVTRTFPISGTYSKEAKAIYDIVAKMQEEYIAMIKPGVELRALLAVADDIAYEGLAALGLLHNGTKAEYKAARVAAAFFPHGIGHQMGLEVHDPNSWRPSQATQPHPQGRRVPPPLEALISSASSVPQDQKFETGMVLTVEPGIYFSRYGMENVYLKDPKWSKYINADLLDTYYPVGGVRIEDDILVTETGYENITTALKGEAACRVIRGDVDF